MRYIYSFFFLKSEKRRSLHGEVLLPDIR